MFGILTALGTPVFLSYIVATSYDSHRYNVSYIYANETTLFVVLFVIGSLFALSSIACGRAGQMKGKLMGGYGLARASFGLVFGYFYFFSTFIMILFCIWLAYLH